MSVVGSQQRTFLHLLAQLRPHWRRDRNLPARIQSLLTGNRAFGSRDRRLYRELIYTTLRHLPWIEPLLDRDPSLATRLAAWLAADSAATAKFRTELLADWPPCPASTADKAAVAHTFAAPLRLDPADLLPAWFLDHCPAAFEPAQRDAFLARAPLWLRLQTDTPARVTDEFAQLGWTFEFSAVLPHALRLLDEVDVTKSAAYQNGFVEIQDLASQLLLESAGIAPGGRWLDACAGAGGKTLQLSRLLGPTGHIDAHDIRPAALDELAARARRAGAANLSILRAPPSGLYDGVLVDAPCSGTGTWRRSPHLKWTTTPAQIDEAAATQRRLLTQFAAHVRPGGRLLYATCSLSHRENEAVISAFLAAHPDFAIDPPPHRFGAPLSAAGLTFLPAHHDTDGFFIAALHRPAAPPHNVI